MLSMLLLSLLSLVVVIVVECVVDMVAHDCAMLPLFMSTLSMFVVVRVDDAGRLMILLVMA